MEKGYKCPVCGKHYFEYENDMDLCPICNWSNDDLQRRQPDYKGGANHMSLNQAREAYKQGKQII